jgi:hypothetical protein
MLVEARKSNYPRLISGFYHSLLVKPYIPPGDDKSKEMLFFTIEEEFEIY